MVEERDAFFMRKALRLAERGRGRTSPNPMVGALLVDADGVIVGRGSHEKAGGPHAEVHALADAGDRARGATLYCTLEPCSHQGRTGPCAPRVAAAGIARAVIAVQDPNPLVSGRGNDILRSHGIPVTCGVLEEDARRLNAAFHSVMEQRRPFVTMKVALSIDGRVAAAPGTRTPLTGTAANRHVHRERAEVDAIAIGSGTVLADDPVLTPRVAYRIRPLVRVVFDRRLRTPPGSAILRTADAGPVVIVTSEEALSRQPGAASALRGAGATIMAMGRTSTLEEVLRALATTGLTSLLVEGGPILHRAFWDAGLVDRVQIYVTPHELGPGGVPWLDEPIVGSARFTGHHARPLGDDVLIEGYVHRID